MIAIKNDIAEKIIPIASDWKANDWLIANTFLQDRILENSKDPYWRCKNSCNDILQNT